MCIQVLLPTTGKSLLCRRSRSPTRKLSPRFSPLAIAPRTFSFQYIASPSRMSPSCFFCFTVFFNHSHSLSPILHGTPVLYPPNLSMDGISSQLPPESWNTFPTTPYYLMPAPKLVVFSHTTLSAISGNLKSGIFHMVLYHFNSLDSLFEKNVYIPSSARSTLLLVIFENLLIV